MNPFEASSGVEVFDDRDVLLDQYVPNDFVGRDEQVDKYIKALMPAHDGHQPNHIFLFGPNGAGKTAATRHVLNQVQSSDQAKADLSSVWLRCSGVGTQYMLAIKLANKILPPDESVSRGHPQDVVYTRLFDALEERGGTHLIVLDEIDRIEDLDTFLYEVTRARSAGGRLDEAKVGIIGISTNSTFYEALSSDTKSSMNDKTIDFPAYDANELRQIIEARVDEAFADGAVDSDVPPLCAAIAAQISGDARFALDLLREAGDIAKQSADDRVEEKHVRQAKEQVLESRVKKLLDNLNNNAKRVVYALAVLAANGETNPRTKTVYNQYKEISAKSTWDPVVSVQVTEYLNEIEQVGLTEIEQNTGSGGRFNRHTLKYEIGDIVSALEDTILDDCVVLDPIAGLVDGDVDDDAADDQGVEA